MLCQKEIFDETFRRPKDFVDCVFRWPLCKSTFISKSGEYCSVWPHKRGKAV